MRFYGIYIPMLNLVIILGDKKVTVEEGCLSLLGVSDVALKSLHVKVVDSIHTQQREYRAPISIIIQHEVDHLDGVLFIDRGIR